MKLAYKKVYCNIFAFNILYDMLKEREPISNISHITMPSYFRHILYVIKNSRRRKEWYLIYNDNLCVGQVYLSRKYTMGVQIYKQYQNIGYGTKALKYIVDKYPNTKLFANINPNNKASIALFEKFGFKHIQNTYRRDAK